MNNKTRIIIAGGRDMEDASFAFPYIDNILLNFNKNEIEIVSGTAKGADTIGRLWAEINNVKVKEFKPDWTKGRHSGHVRNREMGEYASHLIAFWDERSRGTKNMISISKSLNLSIRVVQYRIIKELGLNKCITSKDMNIRSKKVITSLKRR